MAGGGDGDVGSGVEDNDDDECISIIRLGFVVTFACNRGDNFAGCVDVCTLLAIVVIELLFNDLDFCISIASSMSSVPPSS